jgi:hypothetical protein
MQTIKIVISTVAIVVFFMAPSLACLKGQTTSANQSSQIQQYINKTISYPDFAKRSGIEGFVLVKYQINQSGNLKIDAINGSNKQLMNYVQNQLCKLNVPLGEAQNQYAKFVFKLY